MQQIIWFITTFFPKQLIREVIVNLARHIVDQTETEDDDKAVEISLKIYDAWPDPVKMAPLALDMLDIVADLTPTEMDDNIVNALRVALEGNKK